MGKYLKPGKLLQTRCTYFKPESASSALFAAKINANLTDISDGPLKEIHSVSLTEKDMKVAESMSREATALQSHLLWLTDLLVALTQRQDQPSAAATMQPIMTRVLEHLKWVQALLTDSLMTLATNSFLVRRTLPFVLLVVRSQKTC